MIFILIILFIFGLELFIKNKIEAEKELGSAQSCFFNRITITKYHNKGAFLNLGDKKRRLMAAISVGLTVAVTVFFILTLGQRGNVLLKTGLALLLGGAFSNTYDRMKRKYVVDYFRFRTKWKRINAVIFNIADFCIMIGALMAAIALEK